MSLVWSEPGEVVGVMEGIATLSSGSDSAVSG